MSEMKTLEDGLGGRRAVTSLLGVGSVTARRLASRFAVHTVHELASVGTLEEAAAAPGSHAALRKLRLLALEYAMHNVTNATDKTVRKQPTMNTVVKEKTPTMVSRWHPVKVGIVSQAIPRFADVRLIRVHARPLMDVYERELLASTMFRRLSDASLAQRLARLTLLLAFRDEYVFFSYRINIELDLNRLETLVLRGCALDAGDRRAILGWAATAQEQQLERTLQRVFALLGPDGFMRTDKALWRAQAIETRVELQQQALAVPDVDAIGSRTWPGTNCTLRFDCGRFESEQITAPDDGTSELLFLRAKGGVLHGDDVRRVVLALADTAVDADTNVTTHRLRHDAALPTIQHLKLGKRATLLVCPLNEIHAWKTHADVVLGSERVLVFATPEMMKAARIAHMERARLVLVAYDVILQRTSCASLACFCWLRIVLHRSSSSSTSKACRAAFAMTSLRARFRWLAGEELLTSVDEPQQQYEQMSALLDSLSCVTSSGRTRCSTSTPASALPFVQQLQCVAVVAHALTVHPRVRWDGVLGVLRAELQPQALTAVATHACAFLARLPPPPAAFRCRLARLLCALAHRTLTHTTRLDALLTLLAVVVDDAAEVDDVVTAALVRLLLAIEVTSPAVTMLARGVLQARGLRDVLLQLDDVEVDARATLVCGVLVPLQQPSTTVFAWCDVQQLVQPMLKRNLAVALRNLRAVAALLPPCKDSMRVLLFAFEALLAAPAPDVDLSDVYRVVDDNDDDDDDDDGKTSCVRVYQQVLLRHLDVQFGVKLYARMAMAAPKAMALCDDSMCAAPQRYRLLVFQALFALMMRLLPAEHAGNIWTTFVRMLDLKRIGTLARTIFVDGVWALARIVVAKRDVAVDADLLRRMACETTSSFHVDVDDVAFRLELLQRVEQHLHAKEALPRAHNLVRAWFDVFFASSSAEAVSMRLRAVALVKALLTRVARTRDCVAEDEVAFVERVDWEIDVFETLDSVVGPLLTRLRTLLSSSSSSSLTATDDELGVVLCTLGAYARLHPRLSGSVHADALVSLAFGPRLPHLLRALFVLEVGVSTLHDAALKTFTTAGMAQALTRCWLFCSMQQQFEQLQDLGTELVSAVTRLPQLTLFNDLPWGEGRSALLTAVVPRLRTHFDASDVVLDLGSAVIQQLQQGVRGQQQHDVAALLFVHCARWLHPIVDRSQSMLTKLVAEVFRRTPSSSCLSPTQIDLLPALSSLFSEFDVASGRAGIELCLQRVFDEFLADTTGSHALAASADVKLRLYLVRKVASRLVDADVLVGGVFLEDVVQQLGADERQTAWLVLASSVAALESSARYSCVHSRCRWYALLSASIRALRLHALLPEAEEGVRLLCRWGCRRVLSDLLQLSASSASLSSPSSVEALRLSRVLLRHCGVVSTRVLWARGAPHCMPSCVSETTFEHIADALGELFALNSIESRACVLGSLEELHEAEQRASAPDTVVQTMFSSRLRMRLTADAAGQSSPNFQASTIATMLL